MASEEEAWLDLPDGAKLYTKTWKPAAGPRAVLIFVHGFSDHCNRYFDFFPNLAETGILVHSFDQRGWGRSVHKPSEKGLTGPTPQVMADITAVIQSHLPSPAPLFLMGHSMGGQEVLYYAAKGPVEIRKQISGFLVEAPYIKLDESAEPSKVTVVVGRLASKLLPHRQMVNQLDASYMCHDQAMCKDWENDPLCHDTGTLEGLAGMLDRAAELDAGKVVISDWDGLCIYIGHGTEDRCTSHKASKKFYEKLQVKDKTLKLYEGCYHCIHLEPEADKKKFTGDVIEWIMARVERQDTNGVETPSKL